MIRNNFIYGIFLGINIVFAFILFSAYNSKEKITKEVFSAKVDYSPNGTKPYIGEIILFAGNFAPKGFAICDGRLLKISENSALFSLLGTNYGGDGVTTFALPDLRGRTPIGSGQGSGLQNYELGQKGGSETAQLVNGGKVMVKDRDASNFRINNMQPYLPINYCIATTGIFPGRD